MCKEIIFLLFNPPSFTKFFFSYMPSFSSSFLGRDVKRVNILLIIQLQTTIMKRPFPTMKHTLADWFFFFQLFLFRFRFLIVCNFFFFNLVVISWFWLCFFLLICFIHHVLIFLFMIYFNSSSSEDPSRKKIMYDFIYK